MTDELREQVARAICGSDYWREPPFNQLHTDALNNQWRHKADAALAVMQSHYDARVRELKDAVVKARDTFANYAHLHLAKGTRDGDQKGAVNHALALEMDEALGGDNG
jgi:hypothetical protein